MCKYAVMIEDPKTIRYHLERAFHLMTQGRPGPVWLDIPVNFQGMQIETDELTGYDPAEDAALAPPSVAEADLEKALEMLQEAERPVIYAGGGIRLAGCTELFHRVVNRMGIPVVTYWNSIDLMETDDPLYCGRGGNMGDRAGNFAVQNSDLVLAVGTRISIRQTGYKFASWARAARVIMVDVDRGELKKPTLHVEMPVWADAKDFLTKLDATAVAPVFSGQDWIERCQGWKRDYPEAFQRHIDPDAGVCLAGWLTSEGD
jgi:acetolactate synthase-1/2/3 large subunit